MPPSLPLSSSTPTQSLPPPSWPLLPSQRSSQKISSMEQGGSASNAPWSIPCNIGTAHWTSLASGSAGEMIITLLVPLLQQAFMSQNVHFVSGPANFPLSLASQRSIDNENAEKSSPPSPAGLHTQPSINVESGDEEGEDRTNKRLCWTHDEDERLIWPRFSKLELSFGPTVNVTSWQKAFNIYSSGQNDKQLMDKAHAFYEADYQVGQFKNVKT
uniref:Uncharacterized protein n=1 Tax=Oryza brachyantha TaxID=4533 RepID=J3MRS4_ORYBR